MKRKAWLLVVVVAVLLAACVIRRASPPSAVSGGQIAPPAATAVPAPAAKPQPARVTRAPAARLARPRPVASAVATESAVGGQEGQSGDWTPKVEAILAGPGNQFRALVGDALVSEGSVVHGYRVRKVQADGVEFEKDGQIWVQKLN